MNAVRGEFGEPEHDGGRPAGQAWPVRQKEAIMIDRRLRRLWDRLQGRKPQMPHFLSEVHLAGIRGIEDLRIQFDYPVSVIAGGNASGKSTVLFAAACAYKVPGAGVRDYVPSTLFPDYRPKKGGEFTDPKPKISIQFEYSTLEDGGVGCVYVCVCVVVGCGYTVSYIFTDCKVVDSGKRFFCCKWRTQ